MTYGEAQDFKAYLMNTTGKEELSRDVTYVVRDEYGRQTDSAQMSKSDPASDAPDRFTPAKA